LLEWGLGIHTSLMSMFTPQVLDAHHSIRKHIFPISQIRS
jgi:hypothetical protein